MKQMGFALVVAIFLDAFVIRILILPSLMTLLGRLNWWPSRSVTRAQAGYVSETTLPRRQPAVSEPGLRQ